MPRRTNVTNAQRAAEAINAQLGADRRLTAALAAATPRAVVAPTPPRAVVTTTVRRTPTAVVTTTVRRSPRAVSKKKTVVTPKSVRFAPQASSTPVGFTARPTYLPRVPTSAELRVAAARTAHSSTKATKPKKAKKHRTAPLPRPPLSVSATALPNYPILPEAELPSTSEFILQPPSRSPSSASSLAYSISSNSNLSNNSVNAYLRLKENAARQHKAATRLAALHRGIVGRRSAATLRNSALRNKALRNKAATRISALRRGSVGRRTASTLKTYRNAKAVALATTDAVLATALRNAALRNTAATRIAAIRRGVVGRRTTNKIKGAKKVQALFNARKPRRIKHATKSFAQDAARQKKYSSNVEAYTRSEHERAAAGLSRFKLRSSAKNNANVVKNAIKKRRSH